MMADARKASELLYDSINRHDVHDVLRRFRPQAVLVGPAGVAEGHEEIAWHYEQLFTAFADLAFTTWRTVDSGDPPMTEWTMTGTHTGPFLMPDGHTLEPTGRRVTIRGCAAYTLEDGLIVTHRVYYDQLELYAQLGCALSPAAS
jgi:predicted ester cyclase